MAFVLGGRLLGVKLVLQSYCVEVLLVWRVLLLADRVPCLVHIDLLIRCVELVAVGVMFLDYGLLVLRLVTDVKSLFLSRSWNHARW